MTQLADHQFLTLIEFMARVNKWVVERDTEAVGAYAYRSHAMEMARTLTTEALAEGLDCYLLIREPDGSWSERPCPKPGREA